ncbi:MAG: hypothetical protein FWG14_01105 [Peptococcaceae bacterium]|nr:hypothetical protein [Peptococcaceae bacterium]
MLSQERADVLTRILSADEARAKTLLSLELNEAVKQINALGNDFTVDELEEYGNAVNASSMQGELGADDLDDVAGGISFSIKVSVPVWVPKVTWKRY